MVPTAVVISIDKWARAYFRMRPRYISWVGSNHRCALRLVVCSWYRQDAPAAITFMMRCRPKVRQDLRFTRHHSPDMLDARSQERLNRPETHLWDGTRLAFTHMSPSGAWSNDDDDTSTNTYQSSTERCRCWAGLWWHLLGTGRPAPRENCPSNAFGEGWNAARSKPRSPVSRNTTMNYGRFQPA